MAFIEPACPLTGDLIAADPRHQPVIVESSPRSRCPMPPRCGDASRDGLRVGGSAGPFGFIPRPDLLQQSFAFLDAHRRLVAVAQQRSKADEDIEMLVGVLPLGGRGPVLGLGSAAVASAGLAVTRVGASGTGPG